MATKSDTKKPIRTRLARSQNLQISAISVAGYKSLYKEQTIDLEGLTVLAGTNSSGKSSMMQPLLLLKQTLDAPYDPGSLLLSGPSVRQTSASQLLSKAAKGKSASTFTVTFHHRDSSTLVLEFRREARKGLELNKVCLAISDKCFEISKDSKSDEIQALYFLENEEFRGLFSSSSNFKDANFIWQIQRERCFFTPALTRDGKRMIEMPFPRITAIRGTLEHLLHVPGTNLAHWYGRSQEDRDTFE